MKPTFKFLFCLAILSAILANLAIPAAVSATEPLVVGVPHSEAYTYANMMKNSFEMALETINKEGGIKGRPLKLVYANDQGKRKPGEQAIQDLVEKAGAIMLVGAYQSSNTIYMGRIADKLDRPLLVSTAADDRITQRKWKNVYRLNPPAKGYTNGLEDFFLNKIKPKSMAIVYENSPYGTSGAINMMWFCRGNDIDLRAIDLVDRLKEDPPDVIYMVSYLKDGALLVKTIRESKLNSLLVPGTREYYDQYTKKYASPPDYHGAEAYSALLVAADVLKRADSYRPASIRAALDKTDMMTPFGPVKFTSYEKFERQNSLPTQVLQIINGKFECVWPQELATANFIITP
jgi:branched-chain amino acid transport system substrate-binding protein